jgi:hypothetical protein
MLLNEIHLNKQAMYYNVTLKRVRVTTVAMEKQKYYIS